MTEPEAKATEAHAGSLREPNFEPETVAGEAKPAREYHPANLPSGLVRRVVALSLVVGLLAGAAGSYGFIKYFASAIPADRKQLVVQESSAVVDVAQKVSPSVVSITSKGTSQGFFGNTVQSSGAGTGIIITADGLIMTNKHVVDDATAAYTVVTSDGKEYANAKVVSRDPLNDVAFVKISASGLPAAQLGDSSAVKVGQRVVAIGNALGQFQNTVTDGIISGLGRPVTAGDQGSGANSETLTNLFQTDAAINPGNSGGPLVNLDGQVIGINTAVAGQAQNIGFAIPINEAKPLVASVKSSGRIVRPYLGVRYVAITPEIAQANNLTPKDGAWLHSAGDNQPAVQADGPAAKAGLKDDDIITKVGNDKITATNSLQALVGKHKVGDKVDLTIYRDGKNQTITVTLQEAPATQ